MMILLMLQLLALLFATGATALTQDQLNLFLREGATAFNTAATALVSQDENEFLNHLKSLTTVMQKILDGLEDTPQMSVESLPDFVSAYTTLEGGILNYTRQLKVYHTAHPEEEKSASAKYDLSAIIFAFEKKQFTLLPENAPCKFTDPISAITKDTGAAVHDVMGNNSTSPPYLSSCVVEDASSLVECTTVTSCTKSQPPVLTVTTYLGPDPKLIVSSVQLSGETIVSSATVSQIPSGHEISTSTESNVPATASTTGVDHNLKFGNSTTEGSVGTTTSVPIRTTTLFNNNSSTASDTSELLVTTIISSVFTTFCPKPTTICFGDERCSTLTERTTLTITDCPCTITRTVQSTATSVYSPTPASSESTSELQSEPASKPTSESKSEATSEQSQSSVPHTPEQSESSVESTSEPRNDAAEPTSAPESHITEPTESRTDITEPTSEPQTDISEATSEPPSDVAEPTSEPRSNAAEPTSELQSTVAEPTPGSQSDTGEATLGSQTDTAEPTPEPPSETIAEPTSQSLSESSFVSSPESPNESAVETTPESPSDPMVEPTSVSAGEDAAQGTDVVQTTDVVQAADNAQATDTAQATDIPNETSSTPDTQGDAASESQGAVDATTSEPQSEVVLIPTSESQVSPELANKATTLGPALALALLALLT